MTSQVRSFGRNLRRYFHDFGGPRAVIASPLFLLAVGMTSFGYRWWLTSEWQALSLSLLPSLLGFSLGTYAILFSLMTNRLKLAMRAAHNESGTPLLNEVNATFFHFIFVQVLALVWAFLSKGTIIFDVACFYGQTQAVQRSLEVLSPIGGAIGTLLLAYSITLVLAAALAVYRIASIVDRGAD